MDLTVDEYQQEIAAALRRYDTFVVCVEKTPEQVLEILRSGEDGEAWASNFLNQVRGIEDEAVYREMERDLEASRAKMQGAR